MNALHQTYSIDVEQGTQRHEEGLECNEVYTHSIEMQNHGCHLDVEQGTQGQEDGFFAIDQERLGGVLDANNVEFLHQYGGIQGVAAALKSDIDNGIKGDDEDLSLRREVFDSNLFLEPVADTKTYNQLALESVRETSTILLLCCATLSVVLGVLKYGAKTGWCDGALMFFVVFITGFVKLYKERKRRNAMSITKKNLAVDVMRDGHLLKIPTSQVVVGDIVILNKGDRVPADGLFIKGNSSFKLNDVEDPLGMNHDHFPAIHAGAEVMNGDCRMLVASVGKNTRRSKMMRLMLDSDNTQKSQLLLKVDKLSGNMEKIVLGLSLVVLVVQLLCYFSRKATGGNGGTKGIVDSKGVTNTSMKELINEAVRVIKESSGVVSRFFAILGVLLIEVREGLHIGIFICFQYSKRKLKLDQAIVTNLPACAELGLVTTIYAGETVDLVLKQTNMAELWVADQKIVMEGTTGVAHEVLNALREGVGLNATGPFEDAFHYWAKLSLGVNMEELEQSCTILDTEASDVDRNCCGLSLTRNGENGKNIIHMHWRGSPELVLPMCSDYYNVDGKRNSMDERQRTVFKQICERIATDCLHCIAFAYKQVVPEEEEKEEEEEEEDEEEEEEEGGGRGDYGEEPSKLIKQNMTLLGFVALKNPYPQELKQAVKACRDAGINITLTVGDDKNTARFMGINSGVLSANEDISKAMAEASEIQNITENDQRVDDIRVLVNPSPSDKLLLVQCLRQKGMVVAVTGENTRDFPAFNEANLGLWIGDGGGKAAEKRSDIIMLNRTFVSIVAILRRGRFIHDNMKKIIQLHLTVSIVGVAINFIAAIPSGETPLSPFQLFWVSLIMDTLGAFALATDPPDQIPVALAPPFGRASSVTSKAIWRNVSAQALYHTGIILMLHFKGKTILQVDQAAMEIIIFNTYVLCQVFALINARQIERTNFSEKIYRNRLFVGMVGATLALQLVVVEIVVVLSHEMKLDPRKWFLCVCLAALSLPVGYVSKYIPVY